MKVRPLIHESLLLLNINGVNPLKYNKTIRIYSLLSLTILVSLSANLFLGLVLKWNGFASVDVIAGFLATYLTISKITTLIFNRTKLCKVLTIINCKFWGIKKCGKDLELETRNLYKLIANVFRTVVVIYSVTYVTFMFKPLLANNKELPLFLYYPSNIGSPTTFAALFTYEFLVGLIIGLPSLVGFDFLFISLTVHVGNEFKKLKHELVNVFKVEDLDSLIDHHSLILQCVKCMNESCSMLLLSQFVTTTFFILVGLLSMLNKGFPPTLEEFQSPAQYIITFSGMMFIYCYCGTYLINESQSVADAAYDTKWWTKTQPEFRRKMQLIIQRANKVEKLRAGGMFDLQLSSFASVIRTAFSFFTLAQAVLTRSTGKGHKEMINM